MCNHYVKYSSLWQCSDDHDFFNALFKINWDFFKKVGNKSYRYGLYL